MNEISELFAGQYLASFWVLCLVSELRKGCSEDKLFGFGMKLGDSFGS